MGRSKAIESGSSHRLRVDKWCGRQPYRVRLLAREVLTQLVPEIEAQGFRWTSEFFPRGNRRIESVNIVPLQRLRENAVDAVGIQLAPGSRPAFSISFRRWSNDELDRGEIWMPHFLSTQTSENWRAKEFGFHRVDFFVTRRRCSRVVVRVKALLPQMLACLEHGTCGPNVTPSARMGVQLSDDEMPPDVDTED